MAILYMCKIKIIILFGNLWYVICCVGLVKFWSEQKEQTNRMLLYKTRTRFHITEFHCSVFQANPADRAQSTLSSKKVPYGKRVGGDHVAALVERRGGGACWCCGSTTSPPPLYTDELQCMAHMHKTSVVHRGVENGRWPLDTWGRWTQITLFTLYGPQKCGEGCGDSGTVRVVRDVVGLSAAIVVADWMASGLEIGAQAADKHEFGGAGGISQDNISLGQGHWPHPNDARLKRLRRRDNVFVNGMLYQGLHWRATGICAHS